MVFGGFRNSMGFLHSLGAIYLSPPQLEDRIGFVDERCFKFGVKEL